MISSAVVIPEPPRDQSPPPTYSLKRKLSHSPSLDSKRPRVQVDELNYDEPQPQALPPPSEPAQSRSSVRRDSTSAISPPRRKSSGLTGVNATEEKKRNKRLFGGLLGTLSQTTTKPAHKKRDEIEARQRERIRQQTEEEEERRLQRKRELDRQRRDQQRAWDEEAMRQRHRNMRDMAGFLRTKTEPRLYYKPWELRPEEEENIEVQKEDAERLVRRELGQDDEEMDDQPVPSTEREDEERQHLSDELDKEQQRQKQKSDHEMEKELANGAGHKSDTEMGDQHLPDSNIDQDQNRDQDEPQKNEQPAEPEAGPAPEVQLIQEDVQKEEDHHDEELVEGQEDDVIY